MGAFADLKERKSAFGDIAQEAHDSDIVQSATGLVRLMGKLVKEGLGESLTKYGQAHSAVKSGLANIVNSAMGDDELRPIEAMVEGFDRGSTPASDVVSGPMKALAGMLPTIRINAPEHNQTIHSTIPVGFLLPDVPGEISPEQYLKGISQGAEVAVDVLTDPLLPVLGPAFKGVGAVGKVIASTNIAKSAVKASLSILPKGLVDWATWAFTVKGGRLPELVSLLDKFHADDAKSRQLALNIRDALSIGLSKEQQLIIGNRIRKFKDTTALADPELEAKAAMARGMLDMFGEAYAKEGFITSEKFFENVGRYFPRMYSKYERKLLEIKSGLKVSPIKIGGQRAMHRKDLSEKARKLMGEIMEPAYPVSRAVQQIQHDLNVHNLFKSVKNKAEWVSDEATAGYKLFDGKKFGVLNGKWVREDIARDLEPVVHLPNKFIKGYLRFLSAYKMLKILPNPASHSRNIFSNTVMADVSPLGGGLLSIPKRLSGAIDEMATNGKYLKEVKANGAWNADYVSQDRAFLEQISREYEQLKDGTDIIFQPTHGFFKNLARRGKGYADLAFAKMSQLYSGEDNAFKLLHYMDARKSGMEIPEAIEYMRKWGLDYSRVSPAVQFMRNYTTPFIAYQAKALPRIAEVIATNPAKFYKWPVIFDAIDRMSARVHGIHESDLQYARGEGGRNMLTPWVDSAGNPLTLDLTYLLPWGDMQEQGGLFGLPASLSISNPAIMIPMQLGMNKNLFTNDLIFNDLKPDGRPRISWENTEKMFQFIYRALMPSIAPGSYSWEKVERSVSPIPEHRLTKTGEPNDFNRVLLDVIYGLKLRGVNIDRRKVFESYEIKGWLLDRKRRISKFVRDASKTEQEKEAFIKKEGGTILDYLEDWVERNEQDQE